MNSVLAQTDEADFVLKKGERSVWIEVDNLSVYIARQDEGVSVDIFPKGEEDGESIAGTWALFSEAPE